MTTFGDNVRNIRKEKGMTQEELALALGYKDRSSVNKIEKNVAQIPQETIQRLADVLGVPVAKLFADAEPVTPAIPSDLMEFLPFLEKAEEWQLESVRRILGMPQKKNFSLYSNGQLIRSVWV